MVTHLGTDVSASLGTDVATGGSAEVPETISGLTAWWRADSGITLNGGDVSDWTDKVLSAVASQGTDTKQPLYNSADSNFNNQPSLSFDSTAAQALGCSDSTVASLVDAGADFTLYFVVNWSSAAASSAHICGWGVDNSNYVQIYCPTNDQWRHGRTSGGSGYDDIGYSAGAGAHYGWWGINSGNSVHSLDGQSELSETAGQNPTGSWIGFAIGARQRATVSQEWDGEIADLILYNRALTAGEKASLDAYATARYGL